MLYKKDQGVIMPRHVTDNSVCVCDYAVFSVSNPGKFSYCLKFSASETCNSCLYICDRPCVLLTVMAM